MEDDLSFPSRFRVSSWSLKALMPPLDDEGRKPGLLVELASPLNLGTRFFVPLAVEQSESSSPEAAGVKPRTVLIAGAAFFMARFFFLAALPVTCGATNVVSG